MLLYQFSSIYIVIDSLKTFIGKLTVNRQTESIESVDDPKSSKILLQSYISLSFFDERS
jgi:hypothetical protein